MARQYGLTLPLRLGSMGYFETTDDMVKQAKSNLTNLLLTVKGERVFQPDFGWDGHSILFEAITDDTVATLNASLDAAIQVWLPFLRLTTATVKKAEDYNRVELKVEYTFLTNQNITDSIVLVF